MANRIERCIVSLSAEQREELEALQRRPSVAAGLVKRARAILLLAEGASVSATGRLVGMQRRHLYKWIDRFRRDGALGLRDGKSLSGNKLDIVVSIVTLMEWKTRRSLLPFRPSTNCSVP